MSDARLIRVGGDQVGRVQLLARHRLPCRPGIEQSGQGGRGIAHDHLLGALPLDTLGARAALSDEYGWAGQSITAKPPAAVPAGTDEQRESAMSFQAYLDAAEKKTGRTPQQIVDLAHAEGFGADTTSGVILAWLDSRLGLGRGHGMALVHVVKNGPGISDRHVGTTGAHRDATAVLRLDGIAQRRPGS